MCITVFDSIGGLGPVTQRTELSTLQVTIKGTQSSDVFFWWQKNILKRKEKYFSTETEKRNHNIWAAVTHQREK